MSQIPTIMTGVVSIIDYLGTRAKAQGEDIPDELIQARTELRRALAQAAADRATDD